jgi:HEAT repeat protein
MVRVVRPFGIALVAALAAVAVRRDGRASATRPGAFAEALRAEEGTAAAERVTDALRETGHSGLRLGFELLGDPDPALRAGAAAYLGRRGSRRALPHLVQLLRDPDARVRRAAAGALGAIGDPRALPFLERALSDDPLEVGETAARAARQIRSAAEPAADG